ncbi:hypothetical protein HHK36_006337 [Tetracentron sinense]|uniref:Defective in cullin neddylation protein n=1 Tax=Tetracentron sinense TaxID=13715 RepID=A0A834ZH03_TETSI|nr:hypothetical protein HHK36_006337 [Tetracentron sinense]
MLAWKMKAEKQGYFTLDEWRSGLKALRADTINKLKKAFPELEKEVRRPSNFVDFYSYAFRYCLTGGGGKYRGVHDSDQKQRGHNDWRSTHLICSKVRASEIVALEEIAAKVVENEDKQKTIDIESICELLDLVLGSQFCPQVDLFIEFLKSQNDYKVVNMDQWMGFLRFCNEDGYCVVIELISGLLEIHLVTRICGRVAGFLISFPDLDNYDPEHAWPLILDNFYEWVRARPS